MHSSPALSDFPDFHSLWVMTSTLKDVGWKLLIGAILGVKPEPHRSSSSLLQTDATAPEGPHNNSCHGTSHSCTAARLGPRESSPVGSDASLDIAVEVDQYLN